MHETIKIGISSCLLGNNVRYDGGNKLDKGLLDSFDGIVTWVPICPEVESGMSVPREPMQLVGDIARPRLFTIETGRDRTDELLHWIEIKMRELEHQGISGFVLKARSPSCGVRSTELFSSLGTPAGVLSGLFAEAVLKSFPSLPVADEEGLRDPGARERFLELVQNKP